MTYLEAIEELEDIQGTCSNNSIYRAIELSIEALKTQTPKEPVYDQETILYRCPVCGEFVSVLTESGLGVQQYNYCHKCGQAINWEKVNEE